MTMLDGQEAAAKEVRPVEMPANEVADRLRDLPGVWDAAPASRKAIAESLFERIDVLGLQQMRIAPTQAAIAHGLAEVWGRSVGYGRGERGWASRTRPALLLINATPREADALAEDRIA